MRPERLFPLFADVMTLKGVGSRVKAALERAMGGRVKDLVLTPPHTLIDRSYQPPISEAKSGEIATFRVTITRHIPPKTRGRPYRIRAYDMSGEITLTFFKPRADYLRQVLPEGTERIISGKVEDYNGALQMTHPDYIVSPKNADSLPLYETIYPLTAGLSQKVARKSVMAALDTVPKLDEWLDPAMKTRQDWPDFNTALLRVHKPQHPLDMNPRSKARQRLAYDEFLAKQLAMAFVREHTRRASGREFNAKGTYRHDVIKAAPFSPTKAQIRACEEIRQDQASPYRMARLLQGDVGSGKTFVAAIISADVAECGAQVALMAPTEILARQHADSLKGFLEPAGLTVQALTGRDKGKPREAILSGLKAGYIDVVVGTHALFQDKVEFKDLGLVIIDEQHRFGVKDRLNLQDKGVKSDLLVMTATPIPRTLALTSYGDLDISKLDEKPAGRRPITTVVMPMARLENVISRLKDIIGRGEQVYWVCPLVEESEVMDLTSAQDRYQNLQSIFGERVGLLHGRMKGEEKERITKAFKAQQFDILVATTVIEVGVDAPNATIIIIEHAERFGLAQLHQLRGRVGRSDKASSCILFYHGQLGETAKARLTTMRESEDGFFIAEKDWELRGSGDLLGVAQSGLPHYKLANLDKHKDLLETAVQDARLFVQKDPKLETERGRAVLDLLYLFEQDYGVQMMRSG